MAYSVKFKRPTKRRKAVPLSTRALAIRAAWAAVAIVALWCVYLVYEYVHYDMPHPHSHAVWAAQLGSAGNDTGEAVTADRDGNVYLAGESDGSLFTKPSSHTGTFIAKYSAVGTRLWGHGFASDGDETVGGTAADSQGCVILAGGTEGSLFGKNPAPADTETPHHAAYIVKLDRAGRIVWAVQFGIPGDTTASAVAVDSRDNIYVCGDTDGSLFATNAGPAGGEPGTGDCWVAKYSPSGRRLYAMQFGGPGDDDASAIAINRDGEAFVAGEGAGIFRTAKTDIDDFIAKVDSDGKLAWGAQVSVRQNSVQPGVACDSRGNSYLTGDMISGEEVLSAAPTVVRYSPSGGVIKKVPMPFTASLDILMALPDSSGGLTMVGSVGKIGGGIDVAGHAFITRCDSVGDRKWGNQVHGAASSVLNAVYVDPDGMIYAAGKTSGALYGPNKGGDDAFVVKVDPQGRIVRGFSKAAK